jgi:hypothetical protein
VSAILVAVPPGGKMWNWNPIQDYLKIPTNAVHVKIIYIFTHNPSNCYMFRSFLGHLQGVYCPSIKHI